MEAIILTAVLALLGGGLLGWALARKSAGVLQERGSAMATRNSALEIEITSLRAEYLEQTRRSGAAEATSDASQHRVGELESEIAVERARAETYTMQSQNELTAAQSSLHSTRSELQVVQSKADSLKSDLDAMRRERDSQSTLLQEKTAELQVTAGAAATFRAQLAAANDRLAEQTAWIATQTTNLKAAFGEVATKVVAEKTAVFKSESQETIQSLLAPLREQMVAFQSRINQIHTADTEGRAGLKELMEALGKDHQSLTQQAQNLSEALTRKPKVQGDFGEMKLEAQLEAGGFSEGHHYLRQPTYRSELEEMKRPDVVIRMPTRTGYLAVDAKVTLAAWVRVASAGCEEDRTLALDETCRCLRDRVDELSAREYPELMDGERAVPFTLMYVPIEGAVLTALEHDPKLFGYAQRRKIIIASPSTLFVLVSIISQLWRVAEQERHAQDIASEGAKLMSKLDGFLRNWEIMGKHLENAQTAYQQADGQLHHGKGNAVTILQRMVAHGVQGKDGGALERSLARSSEVEVSVSLMTVNPQFSGDASGHAQDSVASDSGAAFQTA